MASFCPAVISTSGRREAASTSLPSKGAVTVRSALDARSFWYSSSVSESCFWAAWRRSAAAVTPFSASVRLFLASSVAFWASAGSSS